MSTALPGLALVAGGSLSGPDRLILEAATGARRLTRMELRQVLEHVAGAGFDPTARERVGGRLAGLEWHGRVLKGADELAPVVAHYLRHVVAQREWPEGTSLAQYVQSLHDLVLDPGSGVFVSDFRGKGWQLAVVRRSGLLLGPAGHEWTMVEYRVETGRWVTGFQPALGMAHLTHDPRREAQRWLRHPI